MKGLYKGKYLIAICDKDGLLMDVACSPKELNVITNYHTFLTFLARLEKGERTSKRVLLIDVTEKHDDVFAEEDQLFLNYIEANRNKTQKEQAEMLGINVRTFQRKKRLFNNIEIERE